jgi:hypothetical protein
MPVPANRTPICIARGNLADLQANLTVLQDGEACWAIDRNGLYVVEGSGAGKSLVPAAASVHTSTTAPATPAAGNMWVDNTAGVIRVFDGSSWRVVGVPTAGSAPATPVSGDFWMDGHVLKVYDGLPGPGGGGSLGFVPVGGGLQAGNGVTVNAGNQITGVDEGTY